MSERDIKLKIIKQLKNLEERVDIYDRYYFSINWKDRKKVCTDCNGTQPYWKWIYKWKIRKY